MIISGRGNIGNGGGGGGGVAALDRALICQQEADNVPGGDMLANTWNSRTWNTIEINDGNHVSLDLNETDIIIQPGVYDYWISCSAWKVDDHQARLFDITNNQEEKRGTSEKCSVTGDTQTRSQVTGRLTLTVETKFRVEHYAQTGRLGGGMGNPSGSIPGVEIYGRFEIWHRGEA